MLLNKKNCFDELGYMVDCSRGAVAKVESLKKLVDVLSAFGYTYLMLYTEDTYEVEGEPYFGYMRGRYSKEEIKELDQYCISKNIELRACVQTLAHLGRLTRHADYESLFEINDIFTVKDERVYELIDKMFYSISQMFSSKNVHIGMDEAWALGRGKLLDKYGILAKSKIMNSHLKRVSALASKYGFKCDIWADMLMTAYSESNDKETFKMNIPDNITPIIWRYWEKDMIASEEELKTYKKFCDCELGYAGGTQKWSGFVPNNRYSMFTFDEQITSCIKFGIKRYLVTAWGDCGAEASLYSTLPGIYYASLVSHKLKLTVKAKRYFKKVTGIAFDDYMKVDLLNRIAIDDQSRCFNNLSFVYLYNDLLQGMFDEATLENSKELFENATKQLKPLTKNQTYGHLFKTLHQLSKVCENKAALSKSIYDHYNGKDLVALKKDVTTTKLVLKDVIKLMKVFEEQWHHENKAFGYEKQHYRLGGLKERLEYVIRQLNKYIAGKIEKIDELEEKRLPVSHKWWDHKNQNNNCFNNFQDLVSGGSLREF